MENVRIWDGNFGHYENGWAVTNDVEIPEHRLLSGSENTVWEKGDLFAFGQKNTWGKQEGCAVAIHKSHFDE
jgi:hypothetical protein